MMGNGSCHGDSQGIGFPRAHDFLVPDQEYRRCGPTSITNNYTLPCSTGLFLSRSRRVPKCDGALFVPITLPRQVSRQATGGNTWRSHLLVEDRLGLATETLLLVVITTLALGMVIKMRTASSHRVGIHRRSARESDERIGPISH